MKEPATFPATSIEQVEDANNEKPVGVEDQVQREPASARKAAAGAVAVTVMVSPATPLVALSVSVAVTAYTRGRLPIEGRFVAGTTILGIVIWVKGIIEISGVVI